MERTAEKKIWWKRTGGGSFRLGNRIIKPGQKFEAYPSEISKEFRDVTIPLSKLPAPEESPPLDVNKSEYSLQKRGESLSWFNVVDGQGKIMNDKALRRTAALKLIEELQ